MHGCFGGTVAAHMFKCMQSKVYFDTVETEVHTDLCLLNTAGAYKSDMLWHCT